MAWRRIENGDYLNILHAFVFVFVSYLDQVLQVENDLMLDVIFCTFMHIQKRRGHEISFFLNMRVTGGMVKVECEGRIAHL